MTSLKVSFTELPVNPSEAFPEQKTRFYPVLVTAIEYQGKPLSYGFYSVIDSGADNCIFPAIHGRQLGISIETGKKYPYSGASGPGLAYFHNVKVWVEVEKKLYWFNCYCGFTDGLNESSLGLLGRHGFFELFRSVTFKLDENYVDLEPKQIQPINPKPT